jgi:branched-chain amino acid transport system substrate-binding protein
MLLYIHMKNKIIWIAVVVILIAGVLLYSNNNSSQNTVKIGGLFGLTGPVSFAGEVSRNAFMMALEDRKIDPKTVSIEDTQSKGVGAVSGATKLISVDKVNVIIGPEWSEASNAISKIIDDNKVVAISPWMTNEFEFVKSPYFFSATPSERFELREILKHAKTNNKNRLAVISHAGSAWSEDLLSILKDELKNYPEMSIVYESSISNDISDYKTELAKIKSVNSNAILLMVSQKAHPEVFLRQFRELSVKSAIYFPKGTLGLISADDRKAGLADGVFSPASSLSNRSKEFSDKYLARFGSTPNAISGATTYDAIMLVLDAVEKGAKNSNDVIKYLNSVKDYNGYSGIITFNELGMVSMGKAELREIKGDSFVLAK